MEDYIYEGLKKFIIDNFPFKLYIYVKNGNNSDFVKNCLYKVDKFLNPNYKEINKYVLVNDEGKEIITTINNKIFSVLIDLSSKDDLEDIDDSCTLLIEDCDVLYDIIQKISIRKYEKIFRRFIKRISGEVLQIMKEKEYKILGNEYVVTSNGFLINTDNGYVRKIEEDEHVYHRIDVELYTNIKGIIDKNDVYLNNIIRNNNVLNALNSDIYIKLLKDVIKDILFRNKNIILVCTHEVSKCIFVSILTMMFTQCKDNGNGTLLLYYTYISTVNIFKNKTICLRKSDDSIVNVKNNIKYDMPKIVIKNDIVDNIYLHDYYNFLETYKNLIFSQVIENIRMANASDIFVLIVSKS